MTRVVAAPPAPPARHRPADTGRDPGSDGAFAALLALPTPAAAPPAPLEVGGPSNRTRLDRSVHEAEIADPRATDHAAQTGAARRGQSSERAEGPSGAPGRARADSRTVAPPEGTTTGPSAATDTATAGPPTAGATPRAPGATAAAGGPAADAPAAPGGTPAGGAAVGATPPGGIPAGGIPTGGPAPSALPGSPVPGGPVPGSPVPGGARPDHLSGVDATGAVGDGRPPTSPAVGGVGVSGARPAAATANAPAAPPVPQPAVAAAAPSSPTATAAPPTQAVPVAAPDGGSPTDSQTPDGHPFPAPSPLPGAIPTATDTPAIPAPHDMAPAIASLAQGLARGRDGVARLHVRLATQEFGEVTVRLAARAGVVTLHLSSPVAEHAGELARSDSSLRSVLAEHGLSLGEFSVSTGNGRSPQDRPAPQEPSGGLPHSAAAPPARPRELAARAVTAAPGIWL